MLRTVASPERSFLEVFLLLNIASRKMGYSRTGFGGVLEVVHSPSSVAVEQGFSLLDHIYAKRRHRLSHSTIEKLMILHEQAPEFNTEEMGNILEHAVVLFLSDKRHRFKRKRRAEELEDFGIELMRTFFARSAYVRNVSWAKKNHDFHHQPWTKVEKCLIPV